MMQNIAENERAVVGNIVEELIDTERDKVRIK